MQTLHYFKPTPHQSTTKSIEKRYQYNNMHFFYARTKESKRADVTRTCSNRHLLQINISNSKSHSPFLSLDRSKFPIFGRTAKVENMTCSCPQKTKLSVCPHYQLYFYLECFLKKGQRQVISTEYNQEPKDYFWLCMLAFFLELIISCPS